jgi:hypothetical protein
MTYELKLGEYHAKLLKELERYFGWDRKTVLETILEHSHFTLIEDKEHGRD